MNTARHLAPAPADSGRSHLWDALTATVPEPKHVAPRHNPYRDPWAGNPDTDKNWEKNR